MHLFSVKVHSRNPEKVIYIYHYKHSCCSYYANINYYNSC